MSSTLSDKVHPSEFYELFIRDLDAELKDIRSRSSQYQDMLAAERVAATSAEKQNVNQPGEPVL